MHSAIKYSRNGKPRGGKPLCDGMIYQIIQNPIYVGEIRGHDRTYSGEHQPLISRETWEAAQTLSAARRRSEPHANSTDHFLVGLLSDDLGRRMILAPCRHRGHPYYSYVSSNTLWGYAEYRRAYRCNASQLDKLMIACVTEFLSDRRKLRSALKGLGCFGVELDKLVKRGSMIASHLANTTREAMRGLFRALLVEIEIGEESVSLTFRGRPSVWSTSDARHVLEVPVSALSVHSWPVVHINTRDASFSGKPDAKLVR
jgi:hypothetical protein